MLVIGRRPGESLFIGPDVEIEVLDASASQVKLGIRAPKSVAVVRKEIRVVGSQNLQAAREIPVEGLEKILSVVRISSNKPAPLR